MKYLAPGKPDRLRGEGEVDCARPDAISVWGSVSA